MMETDDPAESSLLADKERDREKDKKDKDKDKDSSKEAVTIEVCIPYTIQNITRHKYRLTRD